MGPLHVAEEPAKLDGEGGTEVGVDGAGAVSNWHGLRNQAGTSNHLRIAGHRPGQQAVPKLVGLGARDVRANSRTAGANGPICPEYRGARRKNHGELD